MIKGLYETHLFVENLERSIEFYRTTLKLKQCRFNNERRTAFFWIGKDKQYMLGLWEKPKEQIDIRHFAFECAPDWIQNESLNFLKSRNIKSWNFLNDGTDGPMVFVWMPAIAIYFNDPDGHELEFIGILDGKSKSDNEKRVVNYKEWLKIKGDRINEPFEKKALNLNGKKFKSVSSSNNGEVNSSTLFEYRQKGHVVWATYQGGAVLFGTLSGRIEQQHLTFTYQHQNTNGDFKTGKCKSIIEMKDEKLILKEKWEWTCDDYSKGESILEETK